jgi:hypothetical protein
MMLLPSMLFAGELITLQEFQKLDAKKQVQILKAYKAFVKEVLKNENETEELTAKIRLFLIDQAFAADTFNCFYAGWPSLKKTTTTNGQKKTYCSSPMKSNPQYKKLSESCGKGEMLCQPVLFGSYVCIDVKTQAQRNAAFSQCQKKFEKSGKTMEDLSKELSKADVAPLADELFALVHDICKSGFQSKSGMCTNLKKNVAAIQANKTSTVKVVDAGKEVVDEVLKTEIIKSVEKVKDVRIETVDVNRKITCTQCEQMKKIEQDDEVRFPYEASGPIDQSLTTAKDYCAGGQKGTELEKYFQSAYSTPDDEVGVNITYLEKSKNTANRTVNGHDVDADKMGKSYTYIEDGVEYPVDEMELMYPTRSYQQEFLGRGKEVTFEIIDSPIREEFVNKKLTQRFRSTDMRITQYAFFPRTLIPAIKKRDDKLIMKLTTGEDIVIDAKTGRIAGGVAKDVAPKNQIEVRPTNKRTFPDSDFSYQGEGLYIETKVTYNKDERKPGSMVPVKAIVDGQPQECKLKSEDLWIRDYGYYLPQDHENFLSSYWECKRYKFEKDEELYDLIKKTCPTFKFPPLTLKK